MGLASCRPCVQFQHSELTVQDFSKSIIAVKKFSQLQEKRMVMTGGNERQKRQIQAAQEQAKYRHDANRALNSAHALSLL